VWRVFGWILLTAPIAAVLVHYVGRFFLIDACLDAGGAFDYTRGLCITEGEVSLPYVPYHRQFTVELLVALAFSVIGLVMLFVQARRARDPIV
jgi:hypothetical protein